MNIRSFKASLREHPDKDVRFIFPDGDPIEAEFHVTEVGHVVKNFIDCGGTQRSLETCLLQTWIANNDPEHRLQAGKLAKIMDLSAKILPSDDLEVEVEYQGCAVSQFKVDTVAVAGNELHFTMGNKQTDCLAKELCGVVTGKDESCCATSGKCC